MNPQLIQIKLEVLSDALTRSEVDELTRQLREELLLTRVQSVEPERGEPSPDGTKATEVVNIGTLLVTLLASGGVVSSLIAVLHAAVTRNERASIRVETPDGTIVIEGHNAKEKSQLLTKALSHLKKG